MEAHGQRGDTMEIEMLPEKHKACCLSFALPQPFHTVFVSSLCIVYHHLILGFPLFLTFFLLEVLFQFVVMQVHCSPVGPEKLLFPEMSTTVKQIIISREARSMHNGPFSWSLPWHQLHCSS